MRLEGLVQEYHLEAIVQEGPIDYILMAEATWGSFIHFCFIFIQSSTCGLLVL